ncbi:D-hexose-6-phosphate mutarotase [Noviherbaspirillum galbum]|uniref:Putative glucose-6-phosphate 1-epimerase n=1 Tax=Noviherbaspirillum galbum TaxID=2709383 RepID=A0A6B3SYQ1_9BURK|nr:D-hexose-6-phosphate mutarotase [Noviherbaspirillum galbum]NEX63952.1 D-hexose-6-phosphate mutarotase [Noviherbaspirillum galbum]
MTTTDHIHIGSLPAVRLRARDGAQATVSLFGAQVLSWIPAGGKDQLFLSKRSALDGSKAIRGGIPLIFPQFSDRGPGTRHGFARLSHWRRLHGDVSGRDAMPSALPPGSGIAEFGLEHGDPLGAPWPHRFSLRFRVGVGADRLELSLQVRNAGDSVFRFSAALHTYHGVTDIDGVRVDGLGGCTFLDQTDGGREKTQHEALLALRGTQDRIYPATPDRLAMRDDAREIIMHQTGFTDTVVWNPGPAAGLSDMADEEHRRFVCIEPACITPLELAPGATWTGSHLLVCQPLR